MLPFLRRTWSFIFDNREIPVLAVFLFGLATWACSRIAEEVLNSNVLEYSKTRPDDNNIRFTFTNLSHRTLTNVAITLSTPDGAYAFHGLIKIDAAPPVFINQNTDSITPARNRYTLLLPSIPPEATINVICPYHKADYPVIRFPQNENENQESLDIQFKESDIYTRIAKNRLSIYLWMMCLSTIFFGFLIIGSISRTRSQKHAP